MFKYTYIRRELSGSFTLFIYLYFMYIEYYIPRKDITAIKYNWQLSWCFKYTVYYITSYKSGEIKYHKSI